MKTIRSIYVLLSLLVLGQVAYAGGMLEGRAADPHKMPRHEQVMGAGAESPDMLQAEEAAMPATSAITESQTSQPSGSVGHLDGQSHRKLRVTKREKKEMRMRARKNRKKLRASFLSLRKNKKDDAPRSADDTELILLVILAILLPPLAVFLSEGVTTNFWIDLILTLFFWIPGVIFALIVILR